jgi:hypothetical protein
MAVLTLIHVAGGSAALLAGGAALALRKGGRGHGLAGTIFFASMLVMTLTGVAIAATMPERGTAFIGLLTCYLVVTSWWTARHRDGTAGRFERGAFAVAAAIAITQLSFGLYASGTPNGRLDSLPAAVHFPFAAIAAVAAFLDWSFIRRGRLTGSQRIARHLWRMCTALLIAAFSFFLGQQKVMPEWVQGSPLLLVPPLTVLAAMVFWILRVRFARSWRKAPAVAPGLIEHIAANPA